MFEYSPTVRLHRGLFEMGVLDEVAECVELSEVIESERVIPPDDPDSDFVLSFSFLNILRLPKL